jgi:putative transposase
MRLLVSRLQPLLLLILSFAERLFRHCTAPANSSFLTGTLTDLPRSKAELLAENALLRHQLLILKRQVKRPHLKRRDRFWLLALASRVAHWKQALLIIQPDTLLRWHRQGFRLFWKHRSRAKTNQPKLTRETIDLIQQMAKENLLWGLNVSRVNS